MAIAVLADDDQWNELLNGRNMANLVRIDELADMGNTADACLLLKEPCVYDFDAIARPVLVNSVSITLKEMNAPGNVWRITGWKSFLSRQVWEISGPGSGQARELLTQLDKKMVLVSDEPGLVTARIISMIINEAYFALEDGVSSREEIDTAMKIGTNYPYGPFEWASLIGPAKILALLSKLSIHDKRYLPSKLLKEAARQ